MATFIIAPLVTLICALVMAPTAFALLAASACETLAHEDDLRGY